jgi:hypothetical protein
VTVQRQAWLSPRLGCASYGGENWHRATISAIIRAVARPVLAGPGCGGAELAGFVRMGRRGNPGASFSPSESGCCRERSRLRVW